MSKITISCTNVKCYSYGVPKKIEKEDPEYFKDGVYICPDCGQAIEVDDGSDNAKDPMMRKRILVGLAALIGIALVVWLIIFSVQKIKMREQTPEPPMVEEPITSAPADTVTPAPKTAPVTKPAPTPKLSYGKWSGSWRSGKPHGTGTMRYTEEHLIDSRDPQKRVAMPGDYIIGEFANGKLVHGVWYNSSNNVKGSIIIGM